MLIVHDNTRPAKWIARFPNKLSDFEIQLVGKDKHNRDQVLATADSLKNKTPSIGLTHTLEKSSWCGIKLIRKNVTNKEALRFNLHVTGASTKKGYFNGYEKTATMSKMESPFLICVGSYGQDASGKLAPSPFSSHGQTLTGEVIPHILGPGQLKIDDQVINGTSFSTPFLASLYGFMGSWNIKNLIEASVSHAPLKPGLSTAEKSRWGVPDFIKLMDNPCTKPDKLTDISHEAGKDSLIIRFNYSRKCMEGLSYYPTVALKGNILEDNYRVMTKLMNRSNKKLPLRGHKKYKSQSKHIENQAVEIKIPYKKFKRRYFGVDLEAVFQIRTHAQWDPVGIKGAPEYRFTLPFPAPLSDKFKGEAAYKNIQNALAAGQDKDALDLADRALSSDFFDKEGTHPGAKGYTYWRRGVAHMRLGDPGKAQQDFLASVAAGYKHPMLTADLAMSYFIQKNYAKAEELFTSIDTNDEKGFIYGMYRFLAAVYQNKGKAALARLNENPWGVDHKKWPGALAGLYLNKISKNDLLRLTIQEKKMRNRALWASQSSFFIGELAILTKNIKLAAQSYTQVRMTQVVDDHTYWAAKYMDKP